MTQKYQLTGKLANWVEQSTYERWLRRKAAAHVKRDRSRGNKTANNADYRAATHAAVLAAEGHDDYTVKTTVHRVGKSTRLKPYSVQGGGVHRKKLLLRNSAAAKRAFKHDA